MARLYLVIFGQFFSRHETENDTAYQKKKRFSEQRILEIAFQSIIVLLKQIYSQKRAASIFGLLITVKLRKSNSCVSCLLSPVFEIVSRVGARTIKISSKT